MRFVLCCAILFKISLGSSDCAWFVGRLRCSKMENLVNTVVELYDSDIGYKNFFNKDDLAGRTIVTEEDAGHFKVDGCADDPNLLVVFKNHPEFYLRIHHSCKGFSETKIVTPPNAAIFVPDTNDYFENNPIDLD
ncbi:unnamed protein product [Caenorhabditis angaria]|uniref:Transthyretin-like family protein n=1 Tax=Caenorhabditis angaria TaxID=860376 RepID=A0A9P1N4P8_9PELO|nr:unnamed protein product [Caenorhabditis angaria]